MDLEQIIKKVESNMPKIVRDGILLPYYIGRGGKTADRILQEGYPIVSIVIITFKTIFDYNINTQIWGSFIEYMGLGGMIPRNMIQMFSALYSVAYNIPLYLLGVFTRNEGITPKLFE